MKALILIDLQNDFMPAGALAVPDANHCIDAANHAQQFFNIVIATKDWHPENHLSFAANHANKKPGEFIDLFGLKQTLWPVHCVQNTQGAALVKELDQSQIVHVVTKGQDINVDSYSAFFDNARRHETGLRHYLEQRGIDEIFLLGVALEYCVKFSALDAKSIGLKTNVIVDGCRGIGLAHNDIADAIVEMKDHGILMTTLKEIAHEC